MVKEKEELRGRFQREFAGIVGWMVAVWACGGAFPCSERGRSLEHRGMPVGRTTDLCGGDRWMVIVFSRRRIVFVYDAL